MLEVLIYLGNMKSGRKELTQYFSQQTELIKEIRQQLTEHLEQRFTIEELSKQYLINTSTLKEVFKAVYGLPIATYMKEYPGTPSHEATSGDRCHHCRYCRPGRV